MGFIISFQVFDRTYTIGNGKKKRRHFVSMVTAVLCKLLQLGISKEELLTCLNIAENMMNKNK